MFIVIFFQCPYGIQESVDFDGCERCSCYDPCEQIQCDDGTQCAIALSATRDGQTQYDAVCRDGMYEALFHLYLTPFLVCNYVGILLLSIL